MRITRTVPAYYIGSGALAQLSGLLEKANGPALAPTVFLIDHYFENGSLLERLPVGDSDLVLFIDTTDEPTTEQIDDVTARVRESAKEIRAVVGIGGGSTLDVAKAVSNILGNGGRAEDYQGWDLLKVPGVYKIGIPTLSGTGAEASRTCVLMNHAKNLKLGMNSDFTVFDALVLDPDLTQTVPRDQYFYTAMDTYIHCIESLKGNFRNAFADACSDQALTLCREVFGLGDMQSVANREKMMVASLLGGTAIGNSYVGVVHPLSAGLSMVLGMRHCIANCVVMNVMDEFYPQETQEFRNMISQNRIELPRGVCEGLDDTQMQRLYAASIIHEKPLGNALGTDFKSILTFEKVTGLFQRM
ncbi:MAG: iron-containing alcohol dehydrogenase [Alphaproteobacteria bacterium]|nr:iron-containing alcohol dehydrogenase [Alphaproteobacteria bacterium]